MISPVVLRAVFLVAFLPLCLSLMFPGTGHTAEYPWAAGHTFWSLPSGSYKKLYVTVRVTDRPRSAAHGDFYAMQFWTKLGDGGYMGLQRRGRDHDGTLIPEMAIFSIWGATDASGPNCATFGHEGSGYSCKLAYDWTPDHDYTLIVQRYSTSSSFYWWQAYVKDDTTSVKTYIGRIQVPASWGNLKGGTINFTEFFGSGTIDCSRIQLTRVEFRKMRGERVSDNANLGATPTYGKPGSGECQVSNVNVKGASLSTFQYVHRAGETRSPVTLADSYLGAAFLSTRSTSSNVRVYRWNGSAWASTTLPRGTVVQVRPLSSTFHQFTYNGLTYKVNQAYVHYRLSAHEWY